MTNLYKIMRIYTLSDNPNNLCSILQFNEVSTMPDCGVYLSSLQNFLPCRSREGSISASPQSLAGRQGVEGMWRVRRVFTYWQWASFLPHKKRCSVFEILTPSLFLTTSACWPFPSQRNETGFRDTFVRHRAFSVVGQVTHGGDIWILG